MVEDLGKFYQTQTEADVRKLNDWLQIQSDPAEPTQRGVRNLFSLFPYIAKHWGLAPFTSARLNASSLVPALPDWSKLPPEMSFLAAPAEKLSKRFDYVFSEQGRDAIKERVSQDEMSELRQVAERVRQVGFKNIKTWSSTLGVRENVEASLVFALMGILDALQLPYY